MKPVATSLYQYDRTVYSILDTKGNAIIQRGVLCYSGLSAREFREAVNHKDAKTFQIVYTNTMFNYEPRLRKYGKFFLDFISTSGLFRKGTVRQAKFKDVDDFYLEVYGSGLTANSHIIVLEYDITKAITLQEIFFCGVIMRTISCFPRVLVEFYRLSKKFPNEHPSRLFALAFKLRSNKHDGIEGSGHIFLTARMPHLIPDEDFVSKVQKHIDSYGYPDIKKSELHSFNPSLEHVVCGDMIKDPTSTTWIGMLCKGHLLKPTQEVLDLFKDKEKFLQVFSKLGQDTGKTHMGFKLH